MHTDLTIELLYLTQSTESLAVRRVAYDSTASAVGRNCSCILTEHLYYITYACETGVFLCQSHRVGVNIRGECYKIGLVFAVKGLFSRCSPNLFTDKGKILCGKVP